VTRVLIAEDEPVSRRLLQSYLQKWGYEVAAAADGAEAWRLFEVGPVPVVITDWMMPELDGLGLIRRIRSAHRPGYVYAMLLTAKAQKEARVEGMEAGADDFVTKPFDADLLFARLHVAERILGLQHHVKQLEGLLHICAQCKRIRDENKDWTQLERYITAHSNVLFSHGLCPDCAAAWERQMESMR